MRATVIHGARDIRVETVPDPAIQRPTDVIVRVTATCVCGSDLWPYRGVTDVDSPTRIGHEFVGFVEEIGSAVSGVRPGDFVIAPFAVSDGTCVHCRRGVHTSCERVAWWGGQDSEELPVDGAQGQWVRVPLADGTLVRTPEPPGEEMVPSLLTLSDVMATGHHAALAAGVRPGSSVCVVGDGAVGLCGVLAARRLGAERIVLMSRHADRSALGRRFGATDVVAARGREGVGEVRELFAGIGADSVLECVGTRDSMNQAIHSARPGGRVGYVGVPEGGAELPIRTLFGRNVAVGGGVAPARAYLEELLADVWSGSLSPGPVFDLEIGLEEIPAAYAAMDERRTIKPLVRP